MEPKIVFDVNQAGYQMQLLPCVGLIFFFVGLILAVINYFRKKNGLTAISDRTGRINPLVPWIIMGFAILWFLGTLLSTYEDYRHLRDALNQGRCQVIEGPIEHFHAGTGERGDADDSFDIHGSRFSYSDSSAGAGFSQTQARGEPLKDGLRVRIHAFQGEIARLEILP